MLSFFSMGTRVGLIFFLSAAVPLNFFQVQNLTATIPSGSPSVVTARLECIRMPQTALVQISRTSKRSLLRRADFKPQAPRSRLQAQLGLERPDVPVRIVSCGCDASARCRRS